MTAWTVEEAVAEFAKAGVPVDPVSPYVSAFEAALSEGFCPDCLVPLQDRRPISDLPYCPACHGWWGTVR